MAVDSHQHRCMKVGADRFSELKRLKVTAAEGRQWLKPIGSKLLGQKIRDLVELRRANAATLNCIRCQVRDGVGGICVCRWWPQTSTRRANCRKSWTRGRWRRPGRKDSNDFERDCLG